MRMRDAIGGPARGLRSGKGRGRLPVHAGQVRSCDAPDEQRAVRALDGAISAGASATKLGVAHYDVRGDVPAIWSSGCAGKASGPGPNHVLARRAALQGRAGRRGARPTDQVASRAAMRATACGIAVLDTGFTDGTTAGSTAGASTRDGGRHRSARRSQRRDARRRGRSRHVHRGHHHPGRSRGRASTPAGCSTTTAGRRLLDRPGAHPPRHRSSTSRSAATPRTTWRRRRSSSARARCGARPSLPRRGNNAPTGRSGPPP